MLYYIVTDFSGNYKVTAVIFTFYQLQVEPGL